jgi:hypothetical protein
MATVGQGKRRLDDGGAAALLAGQALVEIRYLAWRGLSGEEQPNLDQLERIHFLADLTHNLPGIARESTLRLRRDRREMEWAWSTAGPAGRAWMLETIEHANGTWTPPPAPKRRTGRARLSLWRKLTVFVRWWPVRTPPGERPLPAAARVLKAVDTEQLVALHDEAEERRLGLGADGAVLREHLDPNGTHYLVPDPAPYYWPGPDGMPWWQCRELLRMADGAQVTSMLAVLPERFAGLPDTLPKREQRRLVHVIRTTGDDLYNWGRDHNKRGEARPGCDNPTG